MLALPAILDELGAATEELLATVGLERTDFSDPENVVPFRNVDALLQRCAAATGCDYLGVLVGREITLVSLGTVGILMQASPSVGDALQVLHRYLHVHDRGAVVDVDIHADRAYLRYLVVVPHLNAVDQIYTIAGLAGCGLMRGLCGPEWRATEVQLPYSPPPRRAVYQGAFGAALRFDADRLAIVFPAADLTRRPPAADPLVWQRTSDRVRVLEAALRLTLPDRVRRLLRSMIFERNPMREALAKRLEISPRTLNRQLADAGTTVRQLRDEVLADVACHLLCSTSKSASEIATLLQYSDVSAFTRAFGRWWGMAPVQWRESTARNPASAE